MYVCVRVYVFQERKEIEMRADRNEREERGWQQCTHVHVCMCFRLRSRPSLARTGRKRASFQEQGPKSGGPLITVS
jgi:hypothetical protein